MEGFYEISELIQISECEYFLLADQSGYMFIVPQRFSVYLQIRATGMVTGSGCSCLFQSQSNCVPRSGSRMRHVYIKINSSKPSKDRAYSTIQSDQKLYLLTILKILGCTMGYLIRKQLISDDLVFNLGVLWHTSLKVHQLSRAIWARI